MRTRAFLLDTARTFHQPVSASFSRCCVFFPARRRKGALPGWIEDSALPSQPQENIITTLFARGFALLLLCATRPRVTTALQTITTGGSSPVPLRKPSLKSATGSGKSRSLVPLLCAALLLSVPGVGPLHAGTFSWTGGGNLSWNDGSDWSGGTAPTGASTDDLVFGSAASSALRATINNLAGAQVNSITISASGYTLSQNAITLGSASAGSGAVTVNAGAANNLIALNVQMGGAAGNQQIFTVDSGADLTVSGQLSGTTGVQLTKQGDGTLTLAGDNHNYTGPIAVATGGGILKITNASALGDTTGGTTIGTNSQLQVAPVSGSIMVNEGLVLNGPGVASDGALLNTAGNNTWAGNIALNSDTTIGASAGSLNITGRISDSGAGFNLTKEGSSQIIFSHAGGNTYRGATTITNGILTIEDPLSLGTADGTAVTGAIVNKNSATGKTGGLQLLDPTGVGFTVFNKQLTLNGAGPAGLGALANANGNNTWTGAVILGSAAPNASPVSIGAAVNTTLTISGVISDPNASGASLTKVDAGTLILTNTNTYTGATNLQSGVLSISANANLGVSSNALNFSGGTLQITGAAVQNFGSHVVNASTFNGGLDIADATNTFTISQALGGSGALTKLGAGKLTLTGNNSYTGTTTLSAGTLQIGNGTTDGSIAASSSIVNNGALIYNVVGSQIANVISGTGSLTKSGAGTLTVTSANTYTGATTVNAGILAVNNGGTLGSGPTTTNGGAVSSAGRGVTQFLGSSTAGSGIFTTNGATGTNGFGGITQFLASSTAGSGTFTNNGGTVTSAAGGSTQFRASSTAGSATLIANAGTGGGSGGSVVFFDDSTGGTATVKVSGNGRLDISANNAASVSIGSLEANRERECLPRSQQPGRGRQQPEHDLCRQHPGWRPRRCHRRLAHEDRQRHHHAHRHEHLHGRDHGEPGQAGGGWEHRVVFGRHHCQRRLFGRAWHPCHPGRCGHGLPRQQPRHPDGHVHGSERRTGLSL